MNTTFSIKKAFKDSFSLMWNNLGFVIKSFLIFNGTLLATLAILFPLNLAYNKVLFEIVRINSRTNPVAFKAAVQQLVALSTPLHVSVAVISLCIVLIIIMTLWVGVTKALLRVSNGQSVCIKDFYTFYTPRSIMYISILTFLLIIFSVTGFLLLIIPGLILMTRFYLAMPLFAGNNLGPIEALKESWRLTSGKALSLFGFMICCTLLGIPLSFIPFSNTTSSLIGVFFMVAAYRQCVSRS